MCQADGNYDGVDDSSDGETLRGHAGDHCRQGLGKTESGGRASEPEGVGLECREKKSDTISEAAEKTG